MLRVYATLKILLHYFSCRTASIFFPYSNAALAFKKLIGPGFDLPEKSRYSYRSLLSGIKSIVALPIQNKTIEQGRSDLIYDVSNDTEKIRTEFLQFYGLQGPFSFTSSNHLLYFPSALDKFLFLFFIIPIITQLLIYGLFKKDKSGISSILKNILITRNALIHVSKGKHKKVYMFSIYNTNSVFLSRSFMSAGISVSQITSEVPLYKWNKITLTNELILCSEYQLLEIKEFKSSIKFDSFKLFGPELFYKIADKYKEDQPKNKKIGFYSTGGWVRTKLGHMDQGTNMEAFENRILQDLNAILPKKKDITLIVYPHPREKAFFNNSETELFNHYRNLLPDTNFELNKKSAANNLLFDDVYLALCYMSTLIFERAHAKRKSVIVYFKEKDFPLKKELDHLSIIDSAKELNEIIEANY